MLRYPYGRSRQRGAQIGEADWLGQRVDHLHAALRPKHPGHAGIFRVVASGEDDLGRRTLGRQPLHDLDAVDIGHDDVEHDVGRAELRIDAAEIDGAGPWRRFLNVTVPLLTPTIFFVLVVGIIGSFQVFTQAYVVSLGQGGPLDSTLFYVFYLYRKGFEDFQMGYASAMAWVLFAVVFGLTLVQLRLSRRWVHY